jgi:NAD(P)-dependent dehydrogenase (short-subunit alcohol dehydrogenase family)
MNFIGKQAIVTGAGSGIGAALCRALVAAGADVVCTDVDGAAAARTAEGLHGPGTATSAALDVTARRSGRQRCALPRSDSPASTC